jgi:hypothetical protein
MLLWVGACDYFRHNNKILMISTFNDIIAFAAACRNDAVAAAGPAGSGGAVCLPAPAMLVARPWRNLRLANTSKGPPGELVAERVIAMIVWEGHARS